MVTKIANNRPTTSDLDNSKQSKSGSDPSSGYRFPKMGSKHGTDSRMFNYNVYSVDAMLVC